MTHHQIEPHLLQFKVGIDIDEGIASQLHTAGGILLNGELVDGGAVVGSIVLREDEGIGTKLYIQHPGNTELQEEVGEEVPGGQWQHLLITAVLIGEDILPVQDAGCEQCVQR